MIKLMKIVALTLIILLPAICGAGQKLSNEEALKIINNDLGYPKLSTVLGGGGKLLIIKQSDPVVKTLIDEKYLTSKKGQDQLWFNQTEKGSKYIGKVDSGMDDIWLQMEYKIIIKGIKDILIDEQANIANVEYVMGYEPIDNNPLFIGLLRRINNGHFINHTWVERVRLKKYDKGWRVMRM